MLYATGHEEDWCGINPELMNIYEQYLAGFILKGKEPVIGKEAIKKLLDAIDTYIPQPIRDLDKPFYLPIEQVFSIAGQ